MKRHTRSTPFLHVLPPLIALLVCVVLPFPLLAEWQPSGTQVTPNGGAVLSYFSLVSDSCGGCYLGYIAYDDPDIPGYQGGRIQRIDRNGDMVWPEGGVYICDPDSIYGFSTGKCVPAPGGGLYVVFTGQRTAETYDAIFVQRLSPEGERLFGARGVQLTLSDTTEYNDIRDQWVNATVPDGVGGIIVGHQYGIGDIGEEVIWVSAHRVSDTGEVLWSNNQVSPENISGIEICRAATSTLGGAAFFTEVQDSLVARYVNLDGEVFWQDNPVIVRNEAYDSEHGFSYACRSYDITPLPDGEFGIANGSYDGVLQYYHLGADGLVQNGQHGTLLLHDSFHADPNFDVACASGNAAIAADDEFVYLVLITKSRNNPDTFNTLLKCSFDGDLITPEPWNVGQVNYSSSTQLFIEPKYQLITKKHDVPYFSYAQLVSRGGELPWGMDGVPVGYPQLYWADRQQTCKTAQDTFVTAWYCWPGANGEGYQAFFVSQIAIAEEDYPVAEENQSPIPSSFRILGAYPDPFNSVVTIDYRVKETGRYVFAVFNVLGETVFQDTIQCNSAGIASWRWSADEVASGVYLVQLQQLETKQIDTKRVTLLR